MTRRTVPALSLWHPGAGHDSAGHDSAPSFVTWGLLILGVLFLSGCGLRQSAVQTPTIAATPPATDTPTLMPGETVSSTATRTPTPTLTQTPTPTHTPTATAMSTPTRPPTLTPSPTPTHPLMIELMRQRTYPGSAPTIESKLEPGYNYDRYIASYLSEGLKIYALLTVPRGQKPATGWPVIVFIHGFIPPEQYRTTERYVAYVDALARSGYVVFRPDLRGHGSSEGEATGPYGTPDYTVDALNAVAAVKRYPDADADRIGMWGHSMGGHITLRAMVVTGDIKARRHLGRRGGVLSRSDLQLAPPADRPPNTNSRSSTPRTPVETGTGRGLWFAGRKPGILVGYQPDLLPEPRVRPAPASPWHGPTSPCRGDSP